LVYFIIILFDQWYKEYKTQVLLTSGVFSYIYNYYYIMLRMHKKTRNIWFYHITDKAENNKRIISVYMCVWMVFGKYMYIKTIRNHLDFFVNRISE
jgi:succinate-acetate transporter protein